MPKVPIDYSKCVIYKIEHINDDRLLYVGLTTNFEQRKGKHKSNCNMNSIKSCYNNKLYRMMRENGGWEMFRMIEVEIYPCNDKYAAEKRECEIMKELKANMNTINCSISKKDMKEERKKRKEYKERVRNAKEKEQNRIYKLKFNRCLDELDFYF